MAKPKVSHDHDKIKGMKMAEWCGPSALSAMLSISAEEAREAFNDFRGESDIDKQTKGVYCYEITAVLQMLDVDFWEDYPQRRISMTAWREFMPPRTRAIVSQSKHVVSYDRETDVVTDTAFPDGVQFRMYPSGRRRVIMAWMIRP